jgi:hypothetical protein
MTWRIRVSIRISSLQIGQEQEAMTEDDVFLVVGLTVCVSGDSLDW